MSLENRKLGKNNINLDNQTIEDEQDTNKNDTLGNLIKASIALAGGTGLYKTGVLRPVVSGLKVFGSKLADSTNAQAYHRANAIKKWANNVNIMRPSNSIFNANKNESFGYSVLKDIKESYNRGELYTTNIRKAIKDTSEDINLLNNLIDKEVKGYSRDELSAIEGVVRKELDGKPEEEIKKEIEKRIQDHKDLSKKETKLKRASIKDSDLLKGIREINRVSEDVLQSGTSLSGRRAVNDAVISKFIKDMTLTEEQAQLQIKRTGFRQLTLGDVFESFDKRTKKLVFKEGLDENVLFEKYNINLKEIDTGNVKGNSYNAKSNIERFLSDPKFRVMQDDVPRAIGYDENIWKNLIIDPAININEKGTNIINYSMGVDSLKFFINSLRKDFGLPALGFNPLDSALKVIPGADKLFNKSVESKKYSFINGIGNFSPYISGKAGRTGDDISTALQKRFNKPEEDFHLLFADGDLYALGTKGTREFLGSGYHAWDITKADEAFKMPHNVEIMREMGNYNLNVDGYSAKPTKEQYNNLTAFQKFKSIVGDVLDIGRQEMRTRKDSGYVSYGDVANIDNAFDAGLERVTKSKIFRTTGFEYKDYDDAVAHIRDKSYNVAFGKGFKDYITEEGFKMEGRNIVLTKEGVGIKTLIEDVKSDNMNQFTEDLGKMVKQTFAGFKKDGTMSENFNEGSSFLYDIFNVLDEGLRSVGLGLSLESKRSTGALLGNLLFRRALPVYMITQIPGMIDYFSEPLFTSKKEKKEGKTDTLGKTLMRDVIKPIDISFHGIGDSLGFTKAMKHLQEMTPGSDQFNELPGIYHLGLGQTKEERKEYIEKGYDPIRKNRYWSISNTPFTGSKIDHWRPNIYRRVEADVKFSDTMYGSRKEYYQNTWYPNLVSPFAPIRHFITDPHHWDKKHYNDRPYAETAPKGENIPLIGPLVSGTVGQIYRKKMHREYWNKDGTLKPIDSDDEKPSLLAATGTSNNIKKTLFSNMKELLDKAFYDTETFNSINANTQEQYHKAANQRLSDLFNVKEFMNKSKQKEYANMNTFSGFKASPMYDNALKSYSVAYNPNTPGKPDITEIPYTEDVSDRFKSKLFTKAKEYSSPLQTSTLPYRDYDKYNTALDVYITPSGQINIVDVPENLNLYKVNEEIKHYSLNKIYGTNQRVDVNEYEQGYQEQEPIEADNDFLYSIGKEINDISNVYGLKGFLSQTMFYGEFNEGATRVETSSYTYSANRSFWDSNLGGLGGELSEISRRFIHKKDNKTEFLNPIRNTMPTWMPGSNYFTDFLHGDPYSKIMNGEERLPGEAYERLNNIDFDFTISTSMLANSRAGHVKHFLHQDTNLTYEQEEAVKSLKKDKRPKEIINDQYDIQNLNAVETFISKILDNFREADVLLGSNIKINDEERKIAGKVDARIKDYHSRTGESLINIRGVSSEEFNKLQKNHDIRNQDYYEMNYDLYALNNTKGRGYVYYYNTESPDDIYKARVKFNKRDLRSSIKNLNDSKLDILRGLKTGEISRGDLYSLVDKYKILADTAPYSQEFKDISSQVSHAHLTQAEKDEVKAARERMKAQKKPLRLYDYKFKTANLKSEDVTVKQVIDNNTIIVEEYGKEHAIKFAGINVSESNSTLYGPTVKEKKKKNKETGRERTIRTGKTMNEAAGEEIRKYLTPGKKITIQYDADERNKYNKDSTQSIRAVVKSRGVNLNRRLLDKKLAKEKENDDSPAGIHARYSKGDIAFGSMMERLTHGASYLPFIGDKFFQIRSPYEQYRKREVYNKDFKSWNHFIRDFVIPTANELSSSQNPILGIMTGAFIGRMTGRNPYGKLMGSIIGGAIPTFGHVIHAAGSDKDHEWRPYRRKQQEELNVYYDTLKYVKNMKLYNKYKDLAKKHDKFDVDAYIEKQEQKGEDNKARRQELNNYKRLVKLDFKHRNNYNFKYGDPKYEEDGQSKKEVIRAINKELSELGSDRKIEKIPLNAIKAISYKQASERTMYGYDPGDDIRNIMAALPKKERQYYSELVKAPEEEKQKILRIAPSYLRRALQSSWGMHVDEKPTLQEYFKNHALPDENWVGWQEDTDLEDVKVKMVNANGMDPGEFDIWTDNKKKADSVNIPIPKLRTRNNAQQVETVLYKLLGNAGVDNINITKTRGINGNSSTINIKEDPRREVEQQINNLDY